MSTAKNRRKVAHKISRGVEKFLEENKDSTEPAKVAVHTAVEGTLKSLQGNIGADLDAVAREQSIALAKTLQKSLFQLANDTWFDHDKGDMMIVPEGTRFVHRQGTTVYIAIEEKPQVRSIRYEKGNRTYNYRVALPYCIFIFPVGTFVDDNGNPRYNLNQGKLAFSKQPLTSLDQEVYCPCLPNINTEDRELKICMGGAFNFNVNETLCEQIRLYITHFWGAPFGTDWAHEFERMGGKDRRFANFNRWQTASEENPLFVLEDEIEYRSAGTFGKLVLENITDSSDINVPLRKIVKTAVDSLGQDVIRTLRQADLLKNFDAKTVDKCVYELMCKCVRDCVDSVTDDLVVEDREEFNSSRDSLEDDLTDLLVTLEKRVTKEKGESSGYWGKI